MGTNFNHYILIYFDDEHEPEETIAEVRKLVEEGYTSGIDPLWKIVRTKTLKKKE